MFESEDTTPASMQSTPFFNKGLQLKKLPADDYDVDYENRQNKKESVLSSIFPSIVLSSTMETPTSFSLSQSTTSKTNILDGESLYDDYEEEYFESGSKPTRKRRDIGDNLSVMLSGACLKGCAIGFYIFTTVSAVINIFGASGRIGNLLVNYR